jgi:hypothetical protein
MVYADVVPSGGEMLLPSDEAGWRNFLGHTRRYDARNQVRARAFLELYRNGAAWRTLLVKRGRIGER